MGGKLSELFWMLVGIVIIYGWLMGFQMRFAYLPDWVLKVAHP